MRWLPAHKTHAIERVALTFQFAEQLPAKPWQAMLNSASVELPKQGFNSTVDELDFTLPGVGVAGPGGALQFHIGGGGAVNPAAVQQTTGGRQFQAVTTGGQIREEVHLSRSRFMHSSLIYDGWASHRARALALLEPHLIRALPLANVQIVKLEYWDRFVFDGPAAEAAYGELLKTGSAFVPRFALETTQLWHAHTGRFVPAEGPVRRLLNVNFDVIDTIDAAPGEQPPGPGLPRRSVGIYTMAQDVLPDSASPATPDAAASTLEGLHTILKDTFADVITPEAADRISLTARAPS